MDQTNKSMKIAAGVAIVLFLGAIAWGGWNARVNSQLNSQLDQEKLRNEQLLSEKLRVEKNLAINESQMDDLVGQNEKLQRQLEEASNLASLKENSIQQLQRQLAANRKTYNQLAAANREMETKLASLNQEIAQLQNERLLASQEAELLRGQIDNLKKELAMAHNAYYDKVLVEATRGKKDKLVVKASRTKKLKATVMIPSDLKEVQFQIFDPAGKPISTAPENGTLAVRIVEPDNSLASSSNGGAAKTYKQAEMTYLPKRKLAAGTYRIEVMSENLSVGSLQVRLR
ncbi:MAG TPA: hypothetical protein VFE50_12275 [Cyclobacteriaceae bacterium]|nr:hypothetical protein [Cyclobacteriaceae bacterium]